MDQVFKLASQVKFWYDMESYGAFKRVDPQSAADARELDVFAPPQCIMEKGTMSEYYGLKTTSNGPTIISHRWFN